MTSRPTGPKTNDAQIELEDDIAPPCFEELRTELKATALFAATGKIGEEGAAEIGETLARIKIPKGFVDGYRPLAPYDVVGMLFAADPRIVERISARQYEKIDDSVNSHSDQDQRLEIQAYLRKNGFEHLLLAGLRSRMYGMAWAVAYRGPAKSLLSEGFTDEEVEIARYTVPSVLFRFLRDRATQASSGPSPMPAGGPLPAGSGPVPLNPHRLRVAILEAQGFSAKAISLKLYRANTTLWGTAGEVRKRLGVEGRNITMQDLEDYAAGRPVSKLRQT